MTSPISSVTMNPESPAYTMTFRRHDGSEETVTVGDARCVELMDEAISSHELVKQIATAAIAKGKP